MIIKQLVDILLKSVYGAKNGPYTCNTFTAIKSHIL